MQLNSIRRTIRALQEIPVVLTVFVLLNYTLDFMGYSVFLCMCPLFGFSLYVILRLYSVARRMHVSRWSRILYVALAAVVLADLADILFGISYRLAEFQQYAFAVFLACVLSSFITYIYGKWRLQDLHAQRGEVPNLRDKDVQ
jgi:uncharacterized membrane protein YeiB